MKYILEVYTGSMKYDCQEAWFEAYTRAFQFHKQHAYKHHAMLLAE